MSRYREDEREACKHPFTALGSFQGFTTNLCGDCGTPRPVEARGRSLASVLERLGWSHETIARGTRRVADTCGNTYVLTDGEAWSMLKRRGCVDSVPMCLPEARS